jgi:hypothetical protein
MSVRRRTPFTVVVLGGLVAANIAAGYAAFSGPGLSQQPKAKVQSNWQLPTLGIKPTSRLAPVEVFTQTLARPIFDKSRRPFAPPKPVEPVRPVEAAQLEPVVVAPPAPDPVLTLGAIARSAKGAKVYISSKSRPSGKWFELGDVVDDWRIAKINRDGIDVENTGRMLSINLLASQDSVTAAPAVQQEQRTPPVKIR